MTPGQRPGVERQGHRGGISHPTVEPRLLDLLNQPGPQAAPELLGALLTTVFPGQGGVSLRITEIEAYGGPMDSDLPDPGAHTYNGRTARNAAMFGPPGHVYVYFTYGMHHAVNLVCRPDGVAGGCLIRAGEVMEGVELARRRRSVRRRSPVDDAALARGPGNVAQALGLTLEHDGAPLASAPSLPGIHLTTGQRPTHVVQTVRTGVSGEGGGQRYPWRFAAAGDPTVSPYRAAVRRRRPR